MLMAGALLLAACGSAKPEVSVGIEHSTSAQHHIVRRPPSKAQRLLTTSSSDRLLGPFIARGAGKNLVAWVDSGEQGVRRVRSLMVDNAGVPVEDTRTLVESAGDVTSLSVKRSSADPASFVVTWTALGARGEALSVLSVGATGAPLATPVEIAHTGEDIVWTDVVPVRRGALLAWAEETHDGKANLLAISLDGTGKPRGVPSYLMRGIVGWHLVPSDTGASLGVLTEVSRKKAAGGFALSLLRIDEDGHPAGAALPVVADGSAQPDFGMVRSGPRGVLFAWTDRSGLDSQVKTTLVDDRDRVGQSKGLSSALSGTRLLTLAAFGASERDALVAWEEPTQRPHAARRVHLQRLGATFDAQSDNTVLELEGKGPPEIVPTKEGAVVLGRMRVCENSETDDACNLASFAPAMVELDGTLKPTHAERIEFGDPAASVQLAWALDCAPGTSSCLSLALGAPEPEGAQPVLAAPAFARTVGERVLVRPLYAPGRPRPESVATIFRTEPVSELATGHVDGASLTAVLTRGTAKSAALYLVAVDKDGHASEGIPLAPRASAAAGAAFATGPDGTLALAWVSREEGGDRVHLTRMSPAGKKLADALVTTKRTDITDVTVAASEGGYVVGWIDGHDGEVYAAKVTSDFSRVAEHQRLTNAPGDASDLTSVMHPSGNVWFAWTDPRESPREGSGDIYVIAVRGKDARKAMEETRVLATAAHSRSPSMVATEDGITIGWIEEAPIGIETEGHAAYGAMLAWLDPRGHAVREPLRLQGAGKGAPVSILLDPEHGGSRGLLARSASEELALDAFTLEGAGRVVSSWLVSPEGPPTLDLPLALDGDAVVFAEEGRSASEYKVRRMPLVWR